jgi:hypothetical protein
MFEHRGIQIKRVLLQGFLRGFVNPVFPFFVAAKVSFFSEVQVRV